MAGIGLTLAAPQLTPAVHDFAATELNTVL